MINRIFESRGIVIIVHVINIIPICIFMMLCWILYNICVLMKPNKRSEITNILYKLNVICTNYLKTSNFIFKCKIIGTNDYGYKNNAIINIS